MGNYAFAHLLDAKQNRKYMKALNLIWMIPLAVIIYPFYYLGIGGMWLFGNFTKCPHCESNKIVQMSNGFDICDDCNELIG